MTSKPRILTGKLDGSSLPLPPTYIDLLQQHFQIIYGPEFSKEPEKYEDIVAIFWRKGPVVNDKLLDRLPKLKIVATPSAGYNHLDLPLIRKRGIKITHTPDVLNDAVAELGISLMINCARNVVRFIDELRLGSFSSPYILNDTTPQFSGSTLGIVGMGGIGYTLAKRARAFNVKILYHNRNRRSSAEEEAIGATYFSNLNEMLPHCDFVMVLVNLTPETTHIMGAEQFKLMKKTAVFSNCSRGETVDQDALVQALKSAEIYGAALDVTTPEPLPKTHELFKLPNVILTPHIASQTTITRLSMAKLAADNILAALDGKPLLTEIPQ